MINIDCKNMTIRERITIKDLLIAGTEFVCAMACVPVVIAVAGLFVTMGK